MKKLSLLFMLISGWLWAQDKQLTVAQSEINWWGYKLAKTEASSHYGTISLKSGQVVLKNNKLVGGTFVLDMTSINATDLSGEYQKKLNDHLKNGDFFEVDKYPTGVFKITHLKKLNTKSYNYQIVGTLTLKGKTHTVSFPAKVSIENDTLSLASNKFSIDRQKWGVAYQSTMKDVVIKDSIDLKVNLLAK